MIDHDSERKASEKLRMKRYQVSTTNATSILSPSVAKLVLILGSRPGTVMYTDMTCN